MESFAQVFPQAPRFAQGVVFLHERVGIDGCESLVAIELQCLRSSGYWLTACTLKPAGLSPASRALLCERGADVTLPVASTIFAGQVDPNDKSHFTIVYELSGAKHTIDGWLMTNRGVKLEARN